MKKIRCTLKEKKRKHNVEVKSSTTPTYKFSYDDGKYRDQFLKNLPYYYIKENGEWYLRGPGTNKLAKDKNFLSQINSFERKLKLEKLLSQ